MNWFKKKNNSNPKIYLAFFLTLIASVLSISCLVSEAPKEEVYFDLSIAEDATSAVLERILMADEKPISKIKFEKGTYHFYPDKGLEKFVHISNHNDVVVRTAMPIFNFKDLIIDGQGSTFIYHGRMIPFLINESNNISIKNVSVDWADSFHSEGKIVASNVNNQTFDLEISEEYPYEIRNEQLIFVKEYYEHHLGQSILYNPKRKAITFDTEKYTPLNQYSKIEISRNLDKINYKYPVDKLEPGFRILGRENALKVEEIKPGLVRVHETKGNIPPVGNILVCKGEQHQNRLAPAFRVTHTYGLNVTNVNVHHAGGMGLIAENSADLILDSFNVTPSKGRMVSTTADATHFVGCRGKVVLRNCTFNNQLDDATNVHGTYQIVQDIKDDYTIGARMGHFQQQGFVIGKEKDTIGLVRLSDSFFPYNKLTIKSIKKINSRYQLITFNEKLPKNLKTGDLLENLDAYPELLVENCNIRNNRARGLLLSSPRKTIIRNNFFSTEMEAILIPIESGHWYESGSVENLEITNNTFQDCQHSGFDRGVIRFDTDDDNQNTAFKNVTITNNVFNQFDNLILQVTNIDGLLFENNTITNSGTFPQLYPNNPVIRLNHSKNIKFEKNHYQGRAKVILQKDNSLKNLKFK